jgi:hypothetical protein
MTYLATQITKKNTQQPHNLYIIVFGYVLTMLSKFMQHVREHCNRELILDILDITNYKSHFKPSRQKVREKETYKLTDSTILDIQIDRK